jgi:hypothetical protein
MELLLPPERLWRKYEEETPAAKRVSRSVFLKYINVASLRMMACKSCLCGPCEEYGFDTFVNLTELIEELVTPTNLESQPIMNEKAKKSFLARVEHLRDYLRHDFRRRCNDGHWSSTLCIRYALSTESAEFGGTCQGHSHSMTSPMCNERFHLIDDVREIIELQRVQLNKIIEDAQAATADDDPPAENPPVDDPSAGEPDVVMDVNRAEDQLAYLDQHLEELAKLETNLDLYVRHLVRKAQSSAISSKLLEELKVKPKRFMLIVDYKAKPLPGKNRETQTAAFGKKGMSLWGATAIRWSGADWEVVNVRVACDDSDQKWFHSACAFKAR